MLRLQGRGLAGGSISGIATLIDMDAAVTGDRVESDIFIIRGNLPEDVLSSLPNRCCKDECGMVMCSGVLPNTPDFGNGKTVAAASGFDWEYFRNGDFVRIDGTSGTVEIENVTGKEVVNCAVKHNDRLLLLKRSGLVGSFRGKWASVSGYVEEGETPYAAALKELREEISAEGVSLLRAGKPVVTRKEATVWISYPFLFTIENDSITIDWEHTEYRWVKPAELPAYDTVPGFGRGLAALGII